MFQVHNFVSIREARLSIHQSDTVEFFAIVAALFLPLTVFVVSPVSNFSNGRERLV